MTDNKEQHVCTCEIGGKATCQYHDLSKSLVGVYKSKNEHRNCIPVSAGAICAFPYCNCETKEESEQRLSDPPALPAASEEELRKKAEKMKDMVIQGLEEGSEEWKMEAENYAYVLKLLVDLKNIHDDEHATGESKQYYAEMKPKAWEQARKLLKTQQAQPRVASSTGAEGWGLKVLNEKVGESAYVKWLESEHEKMRAEIKELWKQIATLQSSRLKDIEDAWDAATESLWYEMNPDKPEPIAPPDKASYLKQFTNKTQL